MVNAKEKRQMMDYLVGRLELTSNVVRPMTYGELERNKISCIYVDNSDVVMLVDRVFPNESFKRAQEFFASKRKNVATVFYKDGENFFRSAAQDNYFKNALGFSLKNYKSEQVQRMLLLRPEEISLAGSKILQYYQPKSERLDEALLSLEVAPVEFDYSHIESSERFKPEDRASKRLYIWNDETRKDLTGDLRQAGNTLVEA